MAAYFNTHRGRLGARTEDEVATERVKGDGLRVLDRVGGPTGRQRAWSVLCQSRSGGMRTGTGSEWWRSCRRLGFLEELAPDRTYRMFQIEGDSMLPIPSGASILCQYVDD